MSDTKEGLDPAIAAAMGFASFGGAPATKKRKLHDNSFVEGQKSQEEKQRRGTSANAVALGERKQRDAGTGSNKTFGDDAPVDEIASVAEKKAKGKGKGKGKDLQGGGLAAFLSHGQSLRARPSAVATSDVGVMTQPATKVEEVAPMDMGSYNLQQLRQGVRDEHGDIAYFLPSFLEDPWKDLV
ncbi:Hypothetical protein D9617_24g017100 [Elsinoe fawcettii]|nr:Hypothetical protein D9617_24g017100 [Elsinoe fawcettii]